MAGEARIDLFDDSPVSRRFQIADDALQIGLPHPRHHCPEVDASLKVSGGKGRAEFVEPKVIWVQSGLRRISFESPEHIGITSSASRTEDQRLGQKPAPRVETGGKLPESPATHLGPEPHALCRPSESS